MKIAFITNLCSHYRYKLFSLLAEKHNFEFYFFDREQKEKVKRLRIYLEGPKFSYLPLLKIFKALLIGKYDLVTKCNNNKWSFLGSFLIAKLTKAKFIVWHSVWYYPSTLQYRLFSWALLRILREYTDAIVVYGEHGKKFLIERGIKAEKIFIAWQAVDNELYDREISNEEIKNVRKGLGIETSKVVLFVGRFEEIKGIDYLLQALSRINKKHDFTTLFIGDGPLRANIEEHCKDAGIRAAFTGLLPYWELPPYYKLATVMVLSSITTRTLKEAWGLVVNEAFNQGCPAVLTDAVGAGVGGLVKDRVNSLIVPERRADKLAQAIEGILTDGDLRAQLSRSALAEIKKWTYERQAQGFLDAVAYAFKGKVAKANEKICSDTHHERPRPGY